LDESSVFPLGLLRWYFICQDFSQTKARLTKRRHQKTKQKVSAPQTGSDGWILFKRLLFSGLGLFFICASIQGFEHDREWSLGLTIMCLVGVAFFALGVFGSRKFVDAADIVP
jgi:hypothetical protein